MGDQRWRRRLPWHRKRSKAAGSGTAALAAGAPRAQLSPHLSKCRQGRASRQHEGTASNVTDAVRAHFLSSPAFSYAQPVFSLRGLLDQWSHLGSGRSRSCDRTSRRHGVIIETSIRHGVALKRGRPPSSDLFGIFLRPSRCDTPSQDASAAGCSSSLLSPRCALSSDCFGLSKLLSG